METNDAGLRLADHIRAKQHNPFVRIVLRTGQPGEAPERDVILGYGIDDYKLKTELTANKLFTVIIACLRTYDSMMTVEDFRRSLEDKVRERTRELVESQRQLEQANAAKDRFFSIFTHDLSNPFTAIHTMAELLKDNYTEFDEDSRMDIVQRMHESSTHIYGLLHSLLEWSRTQTGRISFEPQELDLVGLIRETSMVLSANAHQKNIAVAFELPEELTVYADERMMSTVVRNLMSNAIKFTHEGGKVTVQADGDSEGIELSVTDNGVGMEPDAIERLFELDATRTTRGTANEKGTGLGLLVCKEFVEKHGGRIDVESTPGKGSRFRVTIPRGAAATPQT
jgi:signal transduction histidine kinase